MKTKPVIILCGSAIFLGCAVFWLRQDQTNEIDGAVERQNEGTPQAKNSNVKASEAVIPLHLKAILENRRSSHPRLLRTNSSPADETILLKAYKATTNLQDRYSLTWALAEIGGDATVATFEYALTDEFAGQALRRTAGPTGFDQSGTMHGTVYALGFLAVRNDKAFALLQKGVDPWFWQKKVGWQSDYGTDNYGILASTAIQALGVTGRAEVPELLEKLKGTRLTNDTEPGPYRRTLNGALMGSAFYDWLIRLQGRAAFDHHFFRASDVFDHDGRYGQWEASESGKQWANWSAKFDQKAIAEMMEREKAQKQ